MERPADSDSVLWHMIYTGKSVHNTIYLFIIIEEVVSLFGCTCQSL